VDAEANVKILVTLCYLSRL